MSTNEALHSWWGVLRARADLQGPTPEPLYDLPWSQLICYMFTKDEQRKALPSPLHGDSVQLSGTRLNQTNGKLLHSCRVKVGRHLQSSSLMLASFSHRTVVKPPRVEGCFLTFLGTFFNKRICMHLYAFGCIVVHTAASLICCILQSVAFLCILDPLCLHSDNANS